MRYPNARPLALVALAIAAPLGLSACQASVACDAALRTNTLNVTVEGDDSQVDRVFACTAAVPANDCVIPRQANDPRVSRAPGPWAVVVEPAGEKPDTVTVYAVDVNDKVLATREVPLSWSTDRADERCGSTYKAAATLTL